ncbi:hypothetical protein NP493_5315g00002 [Ridgeia piscesae]|uniref:Uncharacterized protein n=1 Tax=Ridgeia piscesae TaxID=27915 RepID=A0AAD9IUP7_RIDPI|nr:hypothetical protein NP493_5315g00002 [Ridgeia piscesae]
MPMAAGLEPETTGLVTVEMPQLHCVGVTRAGVTTQGAVLLLVERPSRVPRVGVEEVWRANGGAIVRCLVTDCGHDAAYEGAARVAAQPMLHLSTIQTLS